MGAETSVVDQRGWEIVPGDKGTAVDTGDLVVGEDVTLVLCYEPLHTENVQVPGLGVAGQVTDLETGGSRASAIAVSIGSIAVAADTLDGNRASGLALLEFSLNLLEVTLDKVLGRVAGESSMVVMGAMLERNSELKKRQEGKDHGHHARRLAEVGHDEKKVLFLSAYT